eukprot:TRINITY_DN24393_c0_g1_i1.p1 TRINITY_DN24393_c0_g1~~TRINITY_DN24393_c0_g1_i1.p1  ORF type:complete len:201 (+),score=36.98 TRINITY_DN24393_c0_g1_i1:115-717(+)
MQVIVICGPTKIEVRCGAGKACTTAGPPHATWLQRELLRAPFACRSSSAIRLPLSCGSVPLFPEEEAAREWLEDGSNGPSITAGTSQVLQTMLDHLPACRDGCETLRKVYLTTAGPAVASRFARTEQETKGAFLDKLRALKDIERLLHDLETAVEGGNKQRINKLLDIKEEAAPAAAAIASGDAAAAANANAEQRDPPRA